MSWHFPSLVDYYDANTGIVADSARRLSALDDAERAEALKLIALEVLEHTAALPPDMLGNIAVSITDDLYKTLARATGWSDLTTRYVQAVFGTFFGVLGQRGRAVRYIVENTFPDFLDRPILFYPTIFGAIGVPYSCPHLWAYRLAKADGFFGDGEDLTIANLARWIDEGRHMAARFDRQATDSGKHLAHFEIDYTVGSLDEVFALPAPPGTIVIFRNQSPDTSDIQVRFA